MLIEDKEDQGNATKCMICKRNRHSNC